jgi:hypothetical protein
MALSCVNYGRNWCSTLSPVRPTASPDRPITSPVCPTASPVRPTASPVRPTASPVRPTASPVSPTASPVRPTASPDRPTTSPDRPTASPDRPTSSSAHPAPFAIRPQRSLWHRSDQCIQRAPHTEGRAQVKHRRLQLPVTQDLLQVARRCARGMRMRGVAVPPRKKAAPSRGRPSPQGVSGEVGDELFG